MQATVATSIVRQSRSQLAMPLLLVATRPPAPRSPPPFPLPASRFSLLPLQGMNTISKQTPSFDIDALDPYVHVETGQAEPATALIVGARHGVIYSVDYLISKGARLDIAAPNDGNTALHEAARMGHLRVVVSLVEAGADASKVNREGKTAAQLAEAAGYTLVAKTVENPGCVTVTDIAVYTRSHLTKLATNSKSMNLKPQGCWGKLSKWCLA